MVAHVRPAVWQPISAVNIAAAGRTIDTSSGARHPDPQVSVDPQRRGAGGRRHERLPGADGPAGSSRSSTRPEQLDLVRRDPKTEAVCRRSRRRRGTGGRRPRRPRGTILAAAQHSASSRPLGRYPSSAPGTSWPSPRRSVPRRRRSPAGRGAQVQRLALVHLESGRTAPSDRSGATVPAPGSCPCRPAAPSGLPRRRQWSAGGAPAVGDSTHLPRRASAPSMRVSTIWSRHRPTTSPRTKIWPLPLPLATLRSASQIHQGR